MVRIFHFPVFGLNTGKYGPKKVRIWTLFTQSLFLVYKNITVYNLQKRSDSFFLATQLLVTAEEDLGPLQHLSYSSL